MLSPGELLDNACAWALPPGIMAYLVEGEARVERLLFLKAPRCYLAARVKTSVRAVLKECFATYELFSLV